MPEEPHVKEAAQAEFRTPKPAMDGPTGAWQIVRRPAPAHFHDRNTIALLHESMGGNTAPEARTDDDKVKIELVVAVCHISPLRTHCDCCFRSNYAVRFVAAFLETTIEKVSCDRSVHNLTVSILFFCPRTHTSITCPILRSASALCGDSSPNIWKSWFMSSQVSRTTSAPCFWARSAKA